MGQAKHAMMEAEDKRAVAVEIAIKAGVLEYCACHSEHFNPGRETSFAFARGNTMMSRGEVNIFESPKEMAHFVQEVIESAPSKCFPCAKFMEKD
ncbi:hypothetical protein SAMN04490202_0987 [Pseudomonas reinekei]|uniref:Uncharacterized protein n=1 Tax=Pseudomonas reinekei TaxID=395598 RepID=A0A1H0JT10_PSERE|nr:hypothetical protein [Pseudomonas reinekei]KAB0479772.1 hypothetical protein F7R15_28960 [Pseudomonas reinekei]OLT98751.1 hypothetical protein BVK86_28650 [Pseudomonas reinekei]SDO46876.1 hypothetical protein SAMN04490202_0987 [Pseudomonas reinekei]